MSIRFIAMGEFERLSASHAELLAAAKRIVAALDEHDPAYDDLEATFIISGLRDDIKAAIAKAEEFAP